MTSTATTIPHNVAIATLSEGAARPLIREKDPEVKEMAILEVANRLNREQVRKTKGFKIKQIQVEEQPLA